MGNIKLARNHVNRISQHVSQKLAMQAKAEFLLREHRKFVFADDPKIADMHYRAIVRIKKTKTVVEQANQARDNAEYLASEKLLRMWS